MLNTMQSVHSLEPAVDLQAGVKAGFATVRPCRYRCGAMFGTGPLSSCKIWWKSNKALRRERTKCDAFHFRVCL